MSRAAEGVHFQGLAGNFPRGARTLTCRMNRSGPPNPLIAAFYKGFSEPAHPQLLD